MVFLLPQVNLILNLEYDSFDRFRSHYWMFKSCGGSKVEGSHATARATAELLRSLISQKRLPSTNQAEALIEAVKIVGEKLTAANPVGMHSTMEHMTILFYVD